ncbi:MAG TPA: bifunctional phosphopantothenoylcysteine decarboxylase/phosphopantothenate--cysteine ligase CoaBC, partial [Chitinophagaceae bacterium]|nr:bifunctional phosphopantothenoylcysteine decarboxylase/phosphopantothenate--cysteine ligase CoaBC [Chitinophagaceae bacterium]
VLLAPAMDEDMWHHPATKRNLELVKSFGNTIIPVESGELASGLFGEGRMAEPEQIFRFINERFSLNRPLQGKKALVTAGPTYEAIDPVRFIGNHSSGKMGVALAQELVRNGAEVTLVLGPSGLNFDAHGMKIIRVTSASEMYDACQAEFPTTDLAVMAAAVADFTPVQRAEQKIKKTDANLDIVLTKTKDILKSLGNIKRKNQVLVGFALETSNETAHALEKLDRKNADMIVLNSLNDPGAGFGYDTNKVTIFQKGGHQYNFETKSKADVAKDIVDTIIKAYYV